MRGIDSRHEINPNQLLRDTRTLGKRVADFFADRTNAAILLFVLATTTYWIPEIAGFMIFIGLATFFLSWVHKQKLPFRLPRGAKVKDYNDLRPGIQTPNIARGIAFFGNDRRTSEELWFTNDDLRTHVLMFGSTGSGKTVALVSLAYNALVQASGFIYVDGKGDNSLFANIFSMVRSMGREDDLLLINFMTGARDIVGPQEKRLSNTLNPFCQGSSSMLTQLVVSLMGSSSQNSDGDMWKGRAISFVEALMKILVYMRDEGAILLDANTIRNYFDLGRLETIVIDKIFPRDEQEGVNIDSVPKVITDPLRNYVHNLPGYNKEKKGKQVSQVLEQHGFITMQLVRVFSSLADTYGHIIRTNLAEVDFKDVVLNRRILVVLLPALEKSPDELSNLGKIIVSSLKAMMAAGLGEEVEGEYRDVIERKPSNAPSPYLCILDEYGYYAVQGFAVVPAQARSLGFSVIFAGQDLPAFQKASKEEAASIGANTNIKICMKLEDPLETWDFFTKTAGEAYVTKVDSFQTKETSISNSYLDTKSSSFEKRARIDLLDLKDQTEGEAHIFFKSRIVRARMFYANPQPVKRLKLNHFLKVEPPPDDYLGKLQKQLESFQKLLEQKEVPIKNYQSIEDIDLISNAYQVSEVEDLIERGVDALLKVHGYHEPPAPQQIEEEVEEGFLTIFTPFRPLKDGLKVLGKDLEAFSQPLVEAQVLYESLFTVERISGKKDNYAQAMAEELVKDFRVATQYPPEDRVEMRGETLGFMVKNLCDKIRTARQEAANKASEE